MRLNAQDIKDSVVKINPHHKFKVELSFLPLPASYTKSKDSVKFFGDIAYLNLDGSQNIRVAESGDYYGKFRYIKIKTGGSPLVGISNIFTKVLDVDNDGDYERTKRPNLKIINSKIDSLVISSTLKKFTLESSSCKKLNIFICKIKNCLTISNSKIDELKLFWPLEIPDTLQLSSIDLTDFNGLFDLKNFSKKKKVTLILGDLDYQKLKIPIDKFDIQIDTGQSFENKVIMYENVIKSYEEAGRTDKVKELDMEYQELKYLNNGHYIINWISK